jgi:peptidoglycan hydrolase CwlO-like protein
MEERNKNLAILILTVLLLLSWSNYNKLKKETSDTINNYENALNEANSNIDEANSNIEDAKNYAWSSYDDMGWALDNLQTVDNVSY